MFRNNLAMILLMFASSNLVADSFNVEKIDFSNVDSLRLDQLCEIFEDEKVQTNTGINKKMMTDSVIKGLKQWQLDHVGQNIIDDHEIYDVRTLDKDNNLKTVGMAFCKFKDKEHLVLIMALAVHKDFRGKGIASSLLKKIEQVAIDDSLEFVQMKVLDCNKEMLQFCSKFGYEENRPVENLIHCMRKKVSA